MSTYSKGHVGPAVAEYGAENDVWHKGLGTRANHSYWLEFTLWMTILRVATLRHSSLAAIPVEKERAMDYIRNPRRQMMYSQLTQHLSEVQLDIVRGEGKRANDAVRPDDNERTSTSTPSV